MPQSRQTGRDDAAGALDYTPGAILAEFPGCVCRFEIQRCGKLVSACEDNTLTKHVVSSFLNFEATLKSYGKGDLQGTKKENSNSRDAVRNCGPELP